MTSLDDLIGRLERATGPDRELDHWLASFNVEDFGRFKTREAWVKECIAQRWSSRFYTASIDAALALVERKLPGAYGTLQFGLSDGVATILNDRSAVTPKGNVIAETDSATGQAKSLPLAICLALLRVLKAQTSEQNT